MIEGSNVVMTVNIVFITISLFIFLFFFLKGFISSLYDIIAFGIIIVSVTPLSSWLASAVPIVSSGELQNGLFGLFVSRFANQVVWIVISYVVLSIIFLIIKRPFLKRFPLKLDRRLDKGLSMILSGLAIFIFGTLLTGMFLSPVFANGSEIVEQSVLVVFKDSGQQLVDDVSENVGEIGIVSRLLDGETLTLDDQQTIIDLFVSFEVPEAVATTLSKFALELETSEEEIKALIEYAQSQGFTLEDLSQLLKDMGLSQEIIDGFLNDFK
jgi:hypothetical protein